MVCLFANVWKLEFKSCFAIIFQDVKFDKTLQDFEVEIFQCLASMRKKASERVHKNNLENDIAPNLESSECDLNLPKACDICNPGLLVLKWFEHFKIEIQNAYKEPNT